MCDEDWINAAMSDDAVVVDLLLRLHQATPPPPKSATIHRRLSLHHLDWSVRQPRSRSLPRLHRRSSSPQQEEEQRHHKDQPLVDRASPTTPLSFTSATSASNAADFCDDSSRPISLADTPRSAKVTNPNETTSTKRSRKTKTLVELRDEENFLLKERKNLKSELASLRFTVEKHRVTNKSLKRMKLDLESGMDSVAAEGDRSHSYNSFSSTSTMNKVLNDTPIICPDNSIKEQETIKQKPSFLLPDLNLPVEEDSSSNAWA